MKNMVCLVFLKIPRNAERSNCYAIQVTECTRTKSPKHTVSKSWIYIRNLFLYISVKNLYFKNCGKPNIKICTVQKWNPCLPMKMLITLKVNTNCTRQQTDGLTDPHYREASSLRIWPTFLDWPLNLEYLGDGGGRGCFKLPFSTLIFN